MINGMNNDSSSIELSEDINKILSVFPDAILSMCSAGDMVAIPGFGSFYFEKTDELIVTDASGKRFLKPPKISVRFRPSVILRNKLKR